VPVFVVPHLARTLERLSEAGFILLGVGSGGNSLSLPEAKGSRRTAVLFGGEEKGLPPEIESFCDQLLHVPVLPGASLNAAAGGAIVLYELFGRSRTGLSQGL
jgi:tRNA G18 (ribose-2'-O)-methylase SpoU